MIYAFFLAATLALPSHAQTKPADPPPVVVLLPVMGVLTLAATLTGNLGALCARMGGTYKAAPPPADSCPDGRWLALGR